MAIGNEGSRAIGIRLARNILAGIVFASLGAITVPITVALNTVSRLFGIAPYADLSIAVGGILHPAAISIGPTLDQIAGVTPADVVLRAVRVILAFNTDTTEFVNSIADGATRVGTTSGQRAEVRTLLVQAHLIFTTIGVLLASNTVSDLLASVLFGVGSKVACVICAVTSVV
jgi:hypothetical protein